MTSNLSQHEEVLDPKMIMNPRKEYAHDIDHIKTRYRYDRIKIYCSPEFRMLRQRLIRICGEKMASDIMNENV